MIAVLSQLPESLRAPRDCCLPLQPEVGGASDAALLRMAGLASVHGDNAGHCGARWGLFLTLVGKTLFLMLVVASVLLA